MYPRSHAFARVHEYGAVQPLKVLAGLKGHEFEEEKVGGVSRVDLCQYFGLRQAFNCLVPRWDRKGYPS